MLHIVEFAFGTHKSVALALDELLYILSHYVLHSGGRIPPGPYDKDTKELLDHFDQRYEQFKWSIFGPELGGMTWRIDYPLPEPEPPEPATLILPSYSPPLPPRGAFPAITYSQHQGVIKLPSREPAPHVALPPPRHVSFPGLNYQHHQRAIALPPPPPSDSIWDEPEFAAWRRQKRIS
jgi:hypothetical protein